MNSRRKFLRNAGLERDALSVPARRTWPGRGGRRANCNLHGLDFGLVDGHHVTQIEVCELWPTPTY